MPATVNMLQEQLDEIVTNYNDAVVAALDGDTALLQSHLNRVGEVLEEITGIPTEWQEV